ncbi:hypothetical protein [Streptomyces sp. 135]|uniref:phage scaffolding protein n=1 Tax=Streptomyces sp. 135 TaxID=2838850 RepID=UPI001CC1ACE5|nr:hypothetical protein [Streptomyces sp. 135]
MPEELQTPNDETLTPQEPAPPEAPPAGADGDGDGPDPAGTDDLGDAGKKALDSMKSRWKTERDQRRKLEEELETLRSPKPSGTDDKADAAEIKRQATREANAKANQRIIRSEIKAAAAGKLADPSDALAYLDLSQFELDANGDVDAEELADAIEDLLTRKPYLAANGRPRFQGTADGGAARKASGPTQLTRQELNGMSPEAIVKAKREGRLKNILSGG